jgi:hypothetical protein
MGYMLGKDLEKKEQSRYFPSRTSMEEGLQALKSKDPRMADRLIRSLRSYAEMFCEEYEWNIPEKILGNMDRKMNEKTMLVDDDWYAVVFGQIYSLTQNHVKLGGNARSHSDPKSFVKWLFATSRDEEDFMVRLQGSWGGNAGDLSE